MLTYNVNMNWLVIAPDVKNENLKQVEEFLEKKHEITPFEIFIYKGVPKDELYDDLTHILQTTHCIIIDAEKMDEYEDYLFILGALAGKSVKTFIFSESKAVKRYETLDSSMPRSLTKCYSTIESLIKDIDKNFNLFIKRDNQKQALLELFTSGIPYNADSFATYIAKEDAPRCDLFIKAGLMPNARNSEGVPMLCIAARNDSLDRVKWLIKQGADVNLIASDRGYSAIMDAVWRKNHDITKYLIKKGADLNIISSDGQPLMVLAVGNGDVKIVKLLLENGADPDIKDALDMNARGYAKLFKNEEICALIEEYDRKKESKR